MALLDDDLDIGAVARKEIDLGAVLDLGFDFHRARLLLEVQYAGCHAAYMRGEAAVAEGIESDPCAHAFANTRSINFIDRRGDIDAARIDDIHSGRRGD